MAFTWTTGTVEIGDLIDDEHLLEIQSNIDYVSDNITSDVAHFSTHYDGQDYTHDQAVEVTYNGTYNPGHLYDYHSSHLDDYHGTFYGGYLSGQLGAHYTSHLGANYAYCPAHYPGWNSYNYYPSYGCSSRNCPADAT